AGTGFLDARKGLEPPLGEPLRLVVVGGRERDVRADEQRERMQLWVVEIQRDCLGLACVGLCFLRSTKRSRDQSLASGAARGPAELELSAAPVLDHLAVGL